MWPEKNRQMSIKVAQKWFHYKNKCFLTPLQKLPNNAGDLGKIIIATGPKKQKIAQSGHTA